MTDDVNSPAHYNKQGIEVIDVIEAYELPYHLGNVIKYVCRHSYKGHPLKDLKKAQWYLTRHIEALQLQENDEAAQERQRQVRAQEEQDSVGTPCVRRGGAHDFWGSGDLRKCIDCGAKPLPRQQWTFPTLRRSPKPTLFLIGDRVLCDDGYHGTVEGIDPERWPGAPAFYDVKWTRGPKGPCEDPFNTFVCESRLTARMIDPCELKLPLQGRVAGQAECTAYNDYYRYDPTAPDRCCAWCDKMIAVGDVSIRLALAMPYGQVELPFCSLNCKAAYQEGQG